MEADVTAVQHGDDGTAFTVLGVRETLKGDSENILVVRDTAWLCDSDGSVSAERSLCGEPMMREGHRVVLFLELTDMVSSDGRAVYTPVDGAATAKFFFDEDGTYHNALLYSETYCSDMETKGETQMPALDDMTPKTLAQLRDIIKL